MQLENKIPLVGKNLTLRDISLSDCNASYQSWLSDPEVGRFLYSGATHYSIEELKTYVKTQIDSPTTLFLAMVENKTGRHIGNIKLENISTRHHFGTIGLLIGEKSVWGKGYGTESIALLSDYAFRTLKLNKLCASVFKGNTASKKAFEKLGFKTCATREKHFLVDGKYIDEYLLECFANSFTYNSLKAA